MGITIQKDGRVVVALSGATAEEMADHIRNGYPALIPELQAGNLKAGFCPDDALPPVTQFAPPIPLTVEELAEAKEKEKLVAVAQNIPAIVLDHENRILALEEPQLKTTLIVK